MNNFLFRLTDVLRYARLVIFKSLGTSSDTEVRAIVTFRHHRLTISVCSSFSLILLAHAVFDRIGLSQEEIRLIIIKLNF